MKFIIKRDILLESLNHTSKAISSKNLIPILSGIKFELKEEGLYLYASDTDISIKSFIPSDKIEEIKELGSVVISGKYIVEIIRKLPNELINIEEVVDSKLYIYTQNSSFHLNCNNVSEFPNLELEDSKTPLFISQKLFKNIINQTAFATSTQESRPILTGINFHIEGNSLECTATDSYRLAKKTVEVKSLLENSTDIVIPTKNLNELVRLFNDDEDELEMHVFNNKVIFKFNSIVMMSRLINGTYPNTSKLIPTDFELKMVVKYRDFFNSIDRASLLTNEADKNTIKLQSNGNEIIVSSNIPEIGNVEEKLNVVKDNEKEIKIAFSSKYMMDALKSIESEDVELLFNGEIKPIILKNPESDNLIQLILPIRTY